MSERQLIAGISAGIVLSALILGWLASPASPFAATIDPGEGGQVSWRPGVESRRPFVAPGGLYHPSAAGQGRSALIEWGWEWISSPPSEAQIGLGNAG